MQNLNYNQKQTALIKAGRSKDVQPTIGDLFGGVYDYTTVAEYNSLVDAYLAMEEAIHALFEWNGSHGTSFVVNGRDEDNSIVTIDDEPTHPFPIHKPGA